MLFLSQITGWVLAQDEVNSFPTDPLDQAHKEENTAKKLQTKALQQLIECRVPLFAAGKDQLPCLVLPIKSLQTIKAAEGQRMERWFPAPQPASLPPSINFIKHKSPSGNPFSN